MSSNLERIEQHLEDNERTWDKCISVDCSDEYLDGDGIGNEHHIFGKTFTSPMKELLESCLLVAKSQCRKKKVRML